MHACINIKAQFLPSLLGSTRSLVRLLQHDSVLVDMQVMFLTLTLGDYLFKGFQVFYHHFKFDFAIDLACAESHLELDDN